ncbi:hypothetical protein Bca52824_051112 [Brassica carinata]|uniref:Uncharacterized protein n=1 Tax=Brassica carinata TaxID=52824 RepID=A0A8X7R1F9_BRACI|nr:hypothetical protein Bca52824_051112 [Brassica carinata]
MKIFTGVNASRRFHYTHDLNKTARARNKSHATNRFTDIGCERASKLVSSGVQKPKSYAASVGDPGIGLEQLELMCKV